MGPRLLDANIRDQLSDTGPAGEEARVLYAVTFSVPEEDEAEFEAWYQDEHVPLLMKVPGWLRVRRYKRRGTFDGPPWTHFALAAASGTRSGRRQADYDGRLRPRASSGRSLAACWFSRRIAS